MALCNCSTEAACGAADDDAEPLTLTAASGVELQHQSPGGTTSWPTTLDKSARKASKARPLTSQPTW